MPLDGTPKKSTVCHAAFGVMHGVQDIARPADRILGVAAALLVIARARGLSVGELLNQAERVLHDAQLYTPDHLRAATDYARNEL